MTFTDISSVRITHLTPLTVFCLVWVMPAQSQELGLVTSRPCPYSCTTRGLPKSVCRDWKEGDTCYVEDLTKPAAGSSNRTGERDPLGLDDIAPRGDQPRTEKRNSRDDNRGRNSGECAGIARDEIAPPRINISRNRDNSTYRNQETVRGSIEGVCIEEAGYFEDGKKVSSIDIETTRDFSRFDFEIRIRRDRYPELRVYNSAGESDILPLYSDEGASGRTGSRQGSGNDNEDSPLRPRTHSTSGGGSRF